MGGFWKHGIEINIESGVIEWDRITWKHQTQASHRFFSKCFGHFHPFVRVFILLYIICEFPFSKGHGSQLGISVFSGPLLQSCYTRWVHEPLCCGCWKYLSHRWMERLKVRECLKFQEAKTFLVGQWKPAVRREPLINWNRCVTVGSKIVENLR